MAGNLLMSISQDERERAVFRSRRMFHTDRESDMATAEDRGIQKGRAEGRAEGRVEGESAKALAIAKNLLDVGDSIDKIIMVTGLTYEEVENLRTNS